MGEIAFCRVITLFQSTVGIPKCEALLSSAPAVEGLCGIWPGACSAACAQW